MLMAIFSVTKQGNRIIIPVDAGRLLHHRHNNNDGNDAKTKHMVGEMAIDQTDKVPRYGPSAPNPATQVPCPSGVCRIHSWSSN